MKRIIAISTVLFFVFSFFPNVAGAQYGEDVPKNNPTQAGTPISLDNPLTEDGSYISPQEVIGRVINLALGMVGSLALLMFIYGGFLWMTSSGNQERVEQGKRILIWATAGLALIFFSYALVNFIIYQGILGEPSNAPSQEQLNSNDPAGEIGGG